MTTKKNGSTGGESTVDRGAKTDFVRAEIESLCDEIEETVLNTFLESDILDSPGHTACRFYLEVLGDIKQKMVSRIATGKAAESKLVTMN
jgi:hypothetical protein